MPRAPLSIEEIIIPMSQNTMNAVRRLGYSKDQMTAHGFKGMASTRLNAKWAAGIQTPSSVQLHKRMMSGALTCTQPNTGPSPPDIHVENFRRCKDEKEMAATR